MLFYHRSGADAGGGEAGEAEEAWDMEMEVVERYLIGHSPFRRLPSSIVGSIMMVAFVGWPITARVKRVYMFFTPKV